MNTRPLELKDLDTIGIEPDFKEMLRLYIEKHGSTYSRIGELNGKPVFACGVSPMWPGVGEIWIRVFDSSHSVGIIREGKRLLKYLVETFDFHRLQATIRADDPATIRFDQYMGFDIECVKEQFYTDKCDAVILRYHNGT